MDRTVTAARSLHRLAATAVVGTAFLSLTLVGCGGSTTDKPVACDMAAVGSLFGTKYGCNAASCHDGKGGGGNFDMLTSGWQTHLVGVAPKGGGTPATSVSLCAGPGKIYLNAGSNPASGLFIDKISAAPSCGKPMPMVGLTMTAADRACIQSWATTLTASGSDAGSGG